MLRTHLALLLGGLGWGSEGAGGTTSSRFWNPAVSNQPGRDSHRLAYPWEVAVFSCVYFFYFFSGCMFSRHMGLKSKSCFSGLITNCLLHSDASFTIWQQVYHGAVVNCKWGKTEKNNFKQHLNDVKKKYKNFVEYMSLNYNRIEEQTILLKFEVSLQKNCKKKCHQQENHLTVSGLH